MTLPLQQSGRFAPGGEFSVGVEEEMFLLDRFHQLDPTSSSTVVQAVAAATSGAPATASPELFAAQIEFATGVCNDAAEAVGQLSTLRAALSAAGGTALAVGVHPAAPFGTADLSPGEHYDEVARDLAGLLRTPTAALQVHVGLPDEKAALRAYRGIRGHLPVLQALAANSPFWHGRDSGMASARWAVLASYPRGGIPPVLRTWDEYASRTAATADASANGDVDQVWWDARLRPRMGTIEIRIMDAQPSLHVAAALAALVQGLVRHAVEAAPRIDVPSEVLSENSFRTARHGLDTTVVDEGGSHRPVRELASTALAHARAALAPDGLDGPLQEIDRLLREPAECVRQRRVHQRSGLTGLVTDLVDRTALAALDYPVSGPGSSLLV